MKSTIFAMTVVTLLLTGCGSSDDEPTAVVTVTATPEQTDNEPSPSEAAESLALGEEQPVDFGDVTVKDFRPTVDVGEAELMAELGMERWGAALVRTCVGDDWAGEDIKLGWGPWSVATERGETYLFLDLVGQNTVEPTYPIEATRTTRPGTCAEGWVMFDLADGARVSEIIYESPSSNGPLVWSL